MYVSNITLKGIFRWHDSKTMPILDTRTKRMIAKGSKGRGYIDSTSGGMKIVNDKVIQKRSRGDVVTPFYRGRSDSFTILSGVSGKTYYARLMRTGANCSCPWGSHKWTDLRSACHHIQAVFDHLELDRRVSAWCDVERAMRQHRPILDIGDGVTLTSRLIDWR